MDAGGGGPINNGESRGWILGVLECVGSKSLVASEKCEISILSGRPLSVSGGMHPKRSVRKGLSLELLCISQFPTPKLLST